MLFRGDPGDGASAPPGGEGGGAEGRRRAAAQTGASGFTAAILPFLNARLLPARAGGRVFPLPSKPLPERDPQQPAEDLLPGWSGSDVHAAPSAGPGEGRDLQNQKHRQNVNPTPPVFGLQEPVSPPALREPVSRMQLLFDEDEEAETDRAGGGSSRGEPEPEEAAPQHSSWESGQNSFLTSR